MNCWRAMGQVNPARSLLMLTCAALAGLVMAGYALFTARGTSTLIVPAEDVALVNQQPISRSDYLIQLQALYGADPQHSTREQRSKVLNDMIREELFVQRGKELDVASIDPDVRGAMVNAVELEMSADAVTAQPSEADLRAYFGLHRERYASEGTLTLSDWVFPLGEFDAAVAAAVALASTPPSASAMVARHATESGKVTGEEFYFAAKIHLGDALFDVARSLPDAGISIPIRQADGIHLIYVVHNKMPVPFDFATARDRVLSDFRHDAIARLRSGDEQFLHKRANILIASDLQ